MKRLLLVLLPISLFVFSCEEEQSEDTTPPTVSIQSPITNQSINEIVTIVVETNDNEGINRVEFFIDDSLLFTDTESPYEYEWNTTQYEDNSEHVLKVISYDNSDNSTSSQPIIYLINNSTSYPTPPLINTIIFENNSFIISWSQNNDDDFRSYTLYESESEDMSNQTEIFSTEDKSQTTYTHTGIEEKICYYQIVVKDISGLESMSNIQLGNGKSFIQIFGGSDRDIGYSVQQTSDGGYIITGNTESFGNGSTDVWLIKTDNQGNEEWNKTFGGSDIDNGRSVQQTMDGGYIITGLTKSNGGTFNLWLIKTDNQGNEEWNKTPDWEGGFGYSVKQTFDGGYIITGISNTSYDGNPLCLIKTTSYGDYEWIKYFSGGTFGGTGFSIQQTMDGGYIITGRKTVTPTNSDLWLIKTDEQGNEEWNKTFGDSYYDVGNSVQQTMDGGYIITGYSDYGDYFINVLLIKVDSQGNEEWTKTFGGSDDDKGESIIQTIDGGYLITGSTYSHGNGSSDVWLIKTDSQGNEEWNKTFGGSDNDSGYSVQQTIYGGYIITGSTYSYGNGSSDIWLIKTDSEGNTVPYGN
jgi:hypothetical protein